MGANHTTNFKRTIFSAAGVLPGCLMVLGVSPRTFAQCGELQRLVTDEVIGSTISVSGNTAFAGAPSGDCPPGIIGSNCGLTYVYRFDGANWVDAQTLIASDQTRNAFFGLSVSVNGQTAVVGAPSASCIDPDNGNCGSAYVFRFDGTSWIEEQKLTASDQEWGTHFGRSVSTNGETIVVGEYGDDCAAGNNCGSAYVFRFNGITWDEEQKLTASDAGAADQFGWTVSVSGETVVVGAYSDDCAKGDDCGSAYVFRFNGTSWDEEHKLTASDAGANDLFGRTLSVSGETIVVGSEGSYSAYVFRFNGISWDEEQKLTGSNPGANDQFGCSVDVSGGTAVVGAIRQACAVQFSDCWLRDNCGSAYVFRFDGTSWIEDRLLVASDAEPFDGLGLTVSVSGDTAFVGASADRAGVFVFTLDERCPGCENGILEFQEVCDGGIGCTECQCAQGFEPTVPASVDCQPLPVPPPDVLAPILPGRVDGVDHDIRKNRFISFNPNNAEARVALMVEMLDLGCSVTHQSCIEDFDCKTCVGGGDNGDACRIDSDCDGGGVCSLSGESCDELAPARTLGWVSEPFDPGNEAPPNTNGATIVPTAPAFRAWPEKVVHLGDCPIAPVRAYGIRATADLVNFSDHLRIGTIFKPQRGEWADIVGPWDGNEWTAPDSLVNAHDMRAWLNADMHRPAPHVTVMDVVGTAPTWVHWNFNAAEWVLWNWRRFSIPFSEVLLWTGYPDLSNGASLCDCPCVSCPPVECGNGILEFGERCDDGGVQPGDGCDESCQLEAVCGNGTVEGLEECDDGNTDAGDGCDGGCVIEPGCGNGIISGAEKCDDGNTAPGDGCDELCRIETECGNGTREFTEQCDDGNTDPGDGCGATCRREGPIVLEWVPVSSTAASAIAGNDIVLYGTSGAQVEFEAYLSGWGLAPGSPAIKGYNFAFEPMGMAGVNAVPPMPGLDLMAPERVDCIGDGGCATGLCGNYATGQCDDNEPAFFRRKFCRDDNSQPCFWHSQCPGTDICIPNPAFLGSLCGAGSSLVPVQPFEWWAGCQTRAVIDDGSRVYIGSIRLIVPAGASGSYVIDFDHRSEKTFLLDQDSLPIDGLSLVPARITFAEPLALPGVVDGVDHSIQKNRVISFSPRFGIEPARLRVELLDLACSSTGKKCNGDSDCKICDSGLDAGNSCTINSDCAGASCVASGESCDEQSPPLLLGYVGEPTQAGGDAGPGTLRSDVLDDPPAFRVWSETLIHIADCEIAPGRTYGISLEMATVPGVFSDPLVIGTTPKPQGKFWGDLVGRFDGTTWSPPNNLVGVNDVLAVIKFLTLRPAPHVTVVELISSSGPTYVDFDVNVVELQIVMLAFGGSGYPPVTLLTNGYPDLAGGASLADCTGN